MFFDNNTMSCYDACYQPRMSCGFGDYVDRWELFYNNNRNLFGLVIHGRFAWYNVL